MIRLPTVATFVTLSALLLVGCPTEPDLPGDDDDSTVVEDPQPELRTTFSLSSGGGSMSNRFNQATIVIGGPTAGPTNIGGSGAAASAENPHD